MDIKQHRISDIEAVGAFLIVRKSSAESAYAIASTAIDSGLRAVEIAYGTPDALGVIEKLANKYPSEDVLIGAGTVIDHHGAAAAVDHGAKLLVSPYSVPEVMEVAERFQCVSIGGAFTPTEMMKVLAMGGDIVKLFPAESLGPAYVKSIHAPLPQIPISPTGKVNADNIGQWLDAGAVCAGIGGYITNAPSLDEASRATKRIITAVKEWRTKEEEQNSQQ